MTRHSALIIDDERIARNELEYLLKDYSEFEIVGQAASIPEAAERIAALKPELLFLDVQMPGASGFELFERVHVEAWVIFVTAYEEFALRAFEVNALDYLTKPVRQQRLRMALDRFLHRVRPEAPPIGLTMSDSILLTIDRRPRFVKVESIDCILAEGDYSQVIVGGHSLGMVLKSMKEWEKALPENHFCRIQRSAIVNCEHVTRLEQHDSGGYLVHVRNVEAPLIMSRRAARQFRSRFAI
ncbi:LytR/AlgR family response regulator transcription factor [Rhizomicrobium electricum]|uniref:LytTR family DNA-binding domain-containing protein n=1 Tax=Rhizomicrobium electricum TaxID=480070 RepID=A0ABN1F9A4_9PROT|nr:LytTR family DNA-binding domain-containing protein [Rhizomicrobium electricum]NIJ50686.1 two-component system LytT family response regulator [Rhizomicrobium electricum]